MLISLISESNPECCLRRFRNRTPSIKVQGKYIWQNNPVAFLLSHLLHCIILGIDRNLPWSCCYRQDTLLRLMSINAVLQFIVLTDIIETWHEVSILHIYKYIEKRTLGVHKKPSMGFWQICKQFGDCCLLTHRPFFILVMHFTAKSLLINISILIMHVPCLSHNRFYYWIQNCPLLNGSHFSGIHVLTRNGLSRQLRCNHCHYTNG